MLIPVLTEPYFRKYLWAKQTFEGIAQEAARRKYKVMELDAENFETLDYDAIFGEERRMVIVIGSSLSWMPKTLAFFTAQNIEAVFISFDPVLPTLPTGMVRMDYVGAVQHLISYLEDCGRLHIALYGVNPDSAADNMKMRFFKNLWRSRGKAAEDSIFMNYGSLSGCYRVFSKEMDRFDAVICANEIAAVSLLSFLKRDGVSVPDRMFLTTFGDSRIAERVEPSITSATLDHREMGRQAVIQFASIYRLTATASISVRVRSHLIVRGSTAMMPDRITAVPPFTPEDTYQGARDFHKDPEADYLLRAESLLNDCDHTDLQFIQGLQQGRNMEAMEAELFLTGSALQYRRRRLMAAAECSGTADFLEFLNFCHDKGVL